MKLLFLDTETTGLNDPRLVQLAYHVHNEGMYSVGTFKPPKPIEIQATIIHGITNQAVDRSPIFQNSPDFEKLQNLLTDHILVCHNVVFDARVLENEGIKINKTLCTKEMAKEIYPYEYSHSLQHLRYSKGWKIEAIAHSALGDVVVMRELFYNMVDELKKRVGQEEALRQISSFIRIHA